ncbi:MAG: hypothetical protein HPY61_09320 [Methanotrichaceae archaeon]|nr:hypothetical protein [Methanotrichaceae archaeon]
MTKFFVGLDLGQANDYTALSILERLAEGGREATYHVRHLERVRNVPYPDIVAKVTAMVNTPPLASSSVLVIDQTGVGAPVVDLFEQARLDPCGVLIHGGDRETHEGGTWRAPKRNLAAVLQVLFQSGRLKISSKLPLASILQTELLNFKVKIDPVTAHDSYSAWREADHDDLVLSVALAAWRGEREPPATGPLRFTGAKKQPAWAGSGTWGKSRFEEAAERHGGGASFLGGFNNR